MKRAHDAEALPPPELPLLGKPVFPGDELCELSALSRVLLGAGVARDGTMLRACQPGVLCGEAARRRMWSSEYGAPRRSSARGGRYGWSAHVDIGSAR